MTQLILTASPIWQGTLLYQYIGPGITLFCFFCFISLSPFSQLFLSPNLISISFAISISSLSLSPIFLHYTEKHKIFITGANNLLRFAYLWGHRLKIVVLLGRNGNTLKVKTTAKLNDKRTSIATVRGLYRMYATFTTPLGSHYRLLFYDGI
jgi:hypothetical protein